MDTAPDTRTSPAPVLGTRRKVLLSAAAIGVSATLAARSGLAIPVNRACPAFDERTAHCFLEPSSASA